MSRRRRSTPVLLLILVGTLLWVAGPVASAPDTPTVRFSAAGDYSSSSAARSVFSTIGALDDDLHLALGDLSYGAAGAEQQWCDLVTAAAGEGYPFQLLAGNHESNGQNGNINDFSACLPNQLPGVRGTYGRQYYVDVPAAAPLVRFVMISPDLPFPDGTWSYAPGSPRYQWTAAAIDGARSASIPWVVVGMHKPCLSLGQYSCEPGAGLMNLLIDKRVDLVLTGHEHLYQRTAQLRTGPQCPAVTPGTFTAACVADGDADLTAGAGTVFATVGTGGINLRDVNRSDPEAGYFVTASGQNDNPTFGVLGMTATADVLTASFTRAAGGTFSDSFTLTKGAPPPPNNPPTAVFTSACTDLVCQVDGSGSADTDGTISRYDWDFGDGWTAGDTSPTSSRTYASAGTYTVRLTVTDDDGATATTTRNVTVTAPPGTVTTYARDTFTRTIGSGWGTSEIGGAWAGPSSLLSVDGSRGLARVNAGSGPVLTLGSFASTATDLTLSLSADKVPTGSGLYASSAVRRVAGVGDYRAKVRLLSNGSAALSVVRTTAGGGETALAAETTVPGVTVAAGERLNVRVQAIGTAPTTLRARVWKVGTPEPTTWLRSATDSTSGLQAGGAVGLQLYLSSSASNAPITVSVDDLLATSLP